MPRPYVRHKPKPDHRLPDGTVNLIRKMIRDGVGPSEIARIMRVSRMTVRRVKMRMPQNF